MTIAQHTVPDDRTAEAYFRCLGVRIDPHTVDSALSVLAAQQPGGVGRTVHLCNSYTLALARNDDALRDALNRGDLNLPDGAPLAWVGRQIGFDDLTGPARGYDLMTTAVDAGRDFGWRHYLFGSTPDVVEAAAASLRSTYPGAEIVGVESPPFRELTADEMTALSKRVADTGATHVWVGLGTPRQDHFVESFKHQTEATLLAVGAAFDFLAGSKPQAPRWMRGTGIEWLHRLATEPRRLWRRYLFGNTTFVAGIVRGEVEGGARRWSLRSHA